VSKFKNFYQGIFSIKNNNDRKVIIFLGIKLKLKNKKYYAETEKAIKIQDNYNLLKLINAEKIILFFIPNKFKMAGGIMSIFSLCEYSRHINNDCSCLIATHPGKLTYAKNEEFNNSEQIYRWEQIVKNAKNVKELMIHIPEYYAKDFYSDLSKDEIEFLKSVESLHLNIMNQNIELMPKLDNLKKLYKLTSNITQTIAHDRYATQEVCDKWQMPTHLFSCQLRLSPEVFSKKVKEKIILYSPDKNKHKDEFITSLKNKLSAYEFIEINNLTFEEFQELVSRSFVTISFGEGFDGYFILPPLLGSLGLAVYNDNFFPDNSWINLQNVFSSYDEMKQNTAELIKTLENNQDEYCKLVELNKEKHNELYGEEKFKSNLERFYKKKYDFLPVSGGEK